MLRSIRLVLAAFFLIATAVMAWLWFRSYSVLDSTWSREPYASIMTAEGLLIINITGNPLLDQIWWSDFVANYDTHVVEPEDDRPWWEKESVLGFGFTRVNAKRIWINFPFWAPTLLLGAVGTALLFRFPRRFNLLTCFVAMTLLALVLGAGVRLLS